MKVTTEMVMLILSVLGAFFTGARVLIVDPIKDSIIGLRTAIDELNKRIAKTEKSIARLEESDKSAHKRIDELHDELQERR